MRMAFFKATRSTIIAIVVCLFCHGIAAQSKFIVWPKEPGKRLRPGGTPGGQLNVLAQLDTLEIEEILVEGKPIIMGQPFSAGEDWLRNITIRVKNISNQRFSHIQIGLILPEIKEGLDIYVFYPFTAEQRAIGFGPGEVIELKTWRDDKIWKWANDSIAAKMPLSGITTAQIREIVVHLPDGSSLWSECIRTANELNACPHPAAP